MRRILYSLRHVALIAIVVTLSGIALPLPSHGFHAASRAVAQSNTIDHRIIAGVASTAADCYDWQDAEGKFGPGCWHDDETGLPTFEALDLSGAGIGADTSVYHQEFGLAGSVTLVVSAVNPCGPTYCTDGFGCSYVYVQIRNASTGAQIGEEHYLHLWPQVTVGDQWSAGLGWTAPYLGFLAPRQPQNCSFTGAHLHQSGDTSLANGMAQTANYSIGVPPGDDPNDCGGFQQNFICISPLGDYNGRWIHEIEVP